MALAEQHIETQIGNAQHYGRELFVRTLTISALRKREHLFRAFARSRTFCACAVRDFRGPFDTARKLQANSEAAGLCCEKWRNRRRDSFE